MGTGLELGILGSLEVRASGTLVHVGGPRQRALLGLLLCHANQVVSRDELIEELLAGRLPGSAGRMLQVQISRLRQVLGGDGAPRVLARPPGYLLRVEPGELDLEVFEQRVAAGRRALEQGDPGQAAALLGEAESVWRGRPLADLEFEPFARFEIQRLEVLRLQAVENRIEAQLALGQHGAVCPELERLVAEHPLRERLRGQLMIALYRSGRQADALETYRTGRVLLVEELGIEPGPALRHIHERVLAADPELDVPATPGTAILASQPISAVVPRELPADVAGFTGRAAELAELDLLLPGPAGQDKGGAPGAVVISAVAGTAGVGKTALAVHWAQRVAGAFPDGQLYMNLRGYDPDQPVAPGDALARFLRALGVGDQDMPLEAEERAARYRSIVASRRLLVVLDNAASEEQVRPLLPGSGSVMVVVTSRDSLAGLVARDGARRLNLGLLPPAEAMALLTTLIGRRADADPGSVDRLADLCARLPLALRVAAELAIARPDMPLVALAAELAGHDDRLALLDGGGDPRTAVASVFSWSYRHLQPEAARMFRLLGLYPAQHWDLYAAAALTSTAGLASARRTLAELAQAHLIQPAGAGRYQMHDLLRSYAASLAGRHDSDQARRAALTGLFDYYLAACAAAMDCLDPAARRWRPDPPQTPTPVPRFDNKAAARGWLDAELAALVSVAAHAASHCWPGHATRLGATLPRYLYGGRFTEGITIETHALKAARDSGDRTAEARMLATLGILHYYQGGFQRAADCERQSLALARAIGDQVQEARALIGLATLDDQQGRYRQATNRQHQALALFRDLGDQYNTTIALRELGSTCFRQGRYRQATDHQQEALELARQIDDRYSAATLLPALGAVYYRQGRYQQATDYVQQALALSRETRDRACEADALITLGRVHHRRGEHDQAVGYHQRALALHREIGSEHEAEALNGAGETLLATGQPGQARSCYTTALVLARRSGNRYQQGHALIGLAEVSRQQGQHDQAADYHRQALTLLRDIGDRGGQAEALNGAGETLLASGEPARAHDCFAAALTLTRRSGDRYQQARAHRGLVAACHATGQQHQAQQHWQHALNIYTDLGVPEADRMRTNPAPVEQAPSPVTPAST